jgi:hypothetical protein
VILRPRQSAVAVLEWVENHPLGGVPGGCQVPESVTLLVTPPDSTESTALPDLSGVCDAFEIGPVLDDAVG